MNIKKRLEKSYTLKITHFGLDNGVHFSWAGNSFKADHIRNDSYTEVGFGINKLIGVIKLEFIWGINKINENYPFAFNIKADNFDIF